MKITFKKIKIENFKNLEHLETEFGNKTYVYGANETGKTTFADAISYVLTGKNSLGDSQFEFIPVGSSGLSPRVELEIEIRDKKGVKTVNLVRMYEAKKKKNGEFTVTYQTVCYVNGLKMGPKEYDNWIHDHVATPEVFRLIHDVRYFTENISTNGKERPWEAQRRLLFSICGMKSDIDMAKSKKRFNELVDGLSQYDNVNQYLGKLKEDEKKCNQDIELANNQIKLICEKSESIVYKSNGKNICPMCGNVIVEKVKLKDVAPFFKAEELQDLIKEKLEKRAQTCRLIDLCKNFIEMKCKLAQKKVNEMLDGVQVEFFKKNKTNDELVDCCSIYWNGVPYQSLSYSTKFVVSMKIAMAFQKFYGIEIPLIVDNAESIDFGQDFDMQMIFLIKRDECCPNCNSFGSLSRKESDGLSSCRVCGHRFKKTLEVVTEE